MQNKTTENLQNTKTGIQ